MDILASFESMASRCLLSIKRQKGKPSLLSEDIHIPQKPLISFCTVCMGRLHHLKATLPQNLKDNEDCPFVEFVLLNYNSSDGLDAWVNQKMGHYIAKGRLKYFHTRQPQYFHMAHAKNVAHRLAGGDIICNLDADNFTGQGFAYFLAELFMSDKQQVVHGSWKINKSTNGRVAVLRKHFMMVGGYDERMQGWGFEELDLIRRLNNLGLKSRILHESRFLKTIEHGNDDRITHFSPQWRNKVLSHRRNRILSWSHLAATEANQGKSWGVLND